MIQKSAKHQLLSHLSYINCSSVNIFFFQFFYTLFIQIEKPKAFIMDNFRKPIENRDELRPEWKIPSVQAVEKEKKDKEPYNPKRAPEEAPIYTLILAVLKKIIRFFGSSKTFSLSISQKELVYEDLLSFRKMLHLLGGEDQSHNPEFHLHLAELWHNLVNDCQNIAHAAPLFTEIKNLVTQIHRYPQKVDYSLGYYLSAYAGKEWIPFPFLEILKKLHEEHKQNPERSTLTLWIHTLTSILNQIDKNS